MVRLASLAVFAVIAVIIAPLAPLVHADTTVQLTWRDSGYDLAAGYRYTFSLSTHMLWPVGAPEAALSAGPLDIELTWPWNPHLKITVNGETVFDQDLSDASVTIYVTVDCDGSATIEVAGHGNVGGFAIDHSYRIMVSTDTVSNPILGSVTSQVTISRQALNCQITNPSLTPVSENPSQQINYNPLFASITNALSSGAGVAVFIIVLLAGLLLLVWVLGKAGGAKKLVKAAIG